MHSEALINGNTVLENSTNDIRVDIQLVMPGRSMVTRSALNLPGAASATNVPILFVL